jgi:hypothetical protein
MSAAVSIAAEQRKGRRRSEIMGEFCVWVGFGVSKEKIRGQMGEQNA